jgi:hypothetical protein
MEKAIKKIYTIHLFATVGHNNQAPHLTLLTLTKTQEKNQGKPKDSPRTTNNNKKTLAPAIGFQFHHQPIS